MPEDITLPDPAEAIGAHDARVLFLVYGVRNSDDGLGEDLVESYRPVNTRECADARIAEYMRDIRVPVASFPVISAKHLAL